MSWEELDKTRNEQLYQLWNRLTSGSYFHPPVKEVGITDDIVVHCKTEKQAKFVRAMIEKRMKAARWSFNQRKPK